MIVDFIDALTGPRSPALVGRWRRHTGPHRRKAASVGDLIRFGFLNRYRGGLFCSRSVRGRSHMQRTSTPPTPPTHPPASSPGTQARAWRMQERPWRRREQPAWRPRRATDQRQTRWQDQGVPPTPPRSWLPPRRPLAAPGPPAWYGRLCFRKIALVPANDFKGRSMQIYSAPRSRIRDIQITVTVQ